MFLTAIRGDWVVFEKFITILEGIDVFHRGIAGIVGICGLGLLYFGPAWFGPGQAAKEAYADGISYFNAGDFDKAEASFTRAIEGSTKYADAYYFRARARASKHDFMATLQDLRELNSIEPEKARGHVLAGYTYFSIRDFPSAEVELNKSLKIAPDNELALYTRAQYFSWRHDYKRAAQDLQRLLIVKPESQKSIRLLAGIYSRLGDLPKATAQCRKLIRLDRQDAGAPELCGLFYHRANRFEEAIKYYDAALALKPKTESIRENRERATRGEPPLGAENDSTVSS